ncbi:MAG: ABC transporter ATP-binding protein, partial [Firmicutes bacterium]|nr:ABC transporter ATP-binding protein [Bacillota bacterium]
MMAVKGERKHAPKQSGRAAKMMPGEKAQDFKGTIITLFKYLKPYNLLLIVVLLTTILSTVFAIVSPVVLGKATDVVVKGVASGGGAKAIATAIDYSALLKILIILLAMYVASWAFSTIQAWIMAVVSQKVIYKLRDEMSRKLDRLPLKYFDRVPYGEVQSRMINDIETINQTLTASVTQMISAAVTLVGIIAMMLSISLVMTLAALVVIPASLIVIKIVVSKSQKHFKNQQAYLGKVNSHVEEMFSGQDIVKVFNREEISEAEFEEYNDGLCEAAWKSQFLSGLMMPLTALIGNLAYVMVCFFGGYLAIKGRITIGQIQAFIQYVRSFNQPVQQVANIANQLQSTAAAAERVFNLLEEEEEVAAYNAEDAKTYEVAEDSDEPAAQGDPTPEVEGDVRFEHVSFGYVPGEPIINDFNFEAYAGQRIAIV